MIQGKWYAPGTDLSPLLPLRKSLFGQQEDSLDPAGWNVLVYLDDLPVASGRIWWEADAFWLGKIGVLPEYRGRRLGDLVLRLLLFKAQSHSAREVRLTCPSSVSGFFSRLGFQHDPDQPPEEMVLPGDRIELDQCKSCRKTDCPRRANG